MMEKVDFFPLFLTTQTIIPISAFHSTFVVIEAILTHGCNMIINCFSDNFMQANQFKFQCIFFGSNDK